MNITRKLAEFVACTPSGAIPVEARLQARRAILDTLGVALAGCNEEGSRIVAEMVHEEGGVGDALVLGNGFRAPVAGAALSNGTSGHALDYDDVSLSMSGHPSVPLVPAILALGEKLGVSGQEAIDAFVLGFEVQCKIGRAIGGPHYALGWHATSTFGTLGAATACARLLNLGVDATQMALGIATSLSGGVRQNFGSMTKPLHAGWAARNGVVAAMLAERGFTADAEAIEGANGFLRAASGGAATNEQAIVRFGEPWEVLSPGIGVKLHPCCYCTHRAIDAALELRDQYGYDPSSIKRIEVRVTSGTLMPLRTELPETGLEGKFSMEYCVATALTDGPPGFATFSDGAVQRPRMRELMGRVSVKESGEARSLIDGRAEVSVFTGGGDAHTRVVETPRGDPQNPLIWDELCDKFRQCAAPVLGEKRVERAITRIDQIEAMQDTRELTEILDVHG